jgi:hypothetical protein
LEENPMARNSDRGRHSFYASEPEFHLTHLLYDLLATLPPITFHLVLSPPDRDPPYDPLAIAQLMVKFSLSVTVFSLARLQVTHYLLPDCIVEIKYLVNCMEDAD